VVCGSVSRGSLVIFRASPQTHRRFDSVRVIASTNLVGSRNLSMTARAFGSANQDASGRQRRFRRDPVVVTTQQA
jgi:hypothetical protein